MADVEPTALETLFTDYNAKITATEAEIEAWNVLDPITYEEAKLMEGRLGAENEVVTSVGLFGYDLTDFLADCAETEDCDATDYEAFTGWAIGVNWSEGVNE